MGAMRIAVLGGGPGGLYFAALAKQLDARHEITVTERNAADDTFGFGVVFSDETLGGIEHADLEIFSAMRRDSACGSCSAPRSPISPGWPRPMTWWSPRTG
jgi:anthraniloyl-CoA monooxygenase